MCLPGRSSYTKHRAAEPIIRLNRCTTMQIRWNKNEDFRTFPIVFANRSCPSHTRIAEHWIPAVDSTSVHIQVIGYNIKNDRNFRASNWLFAQTTHVDVAPEILHAGSCPGGSYSIYFKFHKNGWGVSELWAAELGVSKIVLSHWLDPWLINTTVYRLLCINIEAVIRQIAGSRYQTRYFRLCFNDTFNRLILITVQSRQVTSVPSLW